MIIHLFVSIKNPNFESRIMKLSIITPSFNQAGFIEETIRSVLDQETGMPVEHIVVDGGSDDGTVDILKKYSGKVIWLSEKDEGQSDAVNKGVEMASGNIIGWLNSDDLYLPGSLKKVEDAFNEKPESLWLYGDCRMIDEQGREVRKWITSYKNRLSRSFSYNKLLLENFISQPAVFFRKDAFLSAGKLDLSLGYAMDYDLWIRLSRLGEPAVIHEDLALFRLHSGSKSIRNYQNLFSEQYRVHERYDRNRMLLLKHRFHIAKIMTLYRLMDLIRSVRSG